MKVNAPGVEIRTRKKTLAVTRTTWLYSDLLQAFKREHPSAVGF